MIKNNISIQKGQIILTYKSIFTAGVARYLLKLGNPIYDIKPDKKNKDKTIFIFEETEKFKNDMASVEKHQPFLLKKWRSI